MRPQSRGRNRLDELGRNCYHRRDGRSHWFLNQSCHLHFPHFRYFPYFRRLHFPHFCRLHSLHFRQLLIRRLLTLRLRGLHRSRLRLREEKKNLHQSPHDILSGFSLLCINRARKSPWQWIALICFIFALLCGRFLCGALFGGLFIEGRLRGGAWNIFRFSIDPTKRAAFGKIGEFGMNSHGCLSQVTLLGPIEDEAKREVSSLMYRMGYMVCQTQKHSLHQFP